MALPAGFAQTLLAQLGKWAEVQQGTNAAMDCVNTDINMEESGTVGTTVNVPINVPVRSQVVNQTSLGYTAPVYNSYGFNTVPVTLTNLIGYSYAFPSIDQMLSPINMQKALVDPALKEVEDSADAMITSVFTAANFGVNSPVSTTGSLITPQQMVQGGKVPLTMQRLKVEDPTKMVFLQHPNVYNTALFTPAWSQNYFVGEAIAEDARRMGVNRVGFGAAFVYDQEMPVSGTVGSRTFTSIYMARDCISAAYRPVPLGEGDSLLISEYVIYKGLPLAVELSYLGKDKQYYYNVQIAMGVKVIRPDWGVIFTTAE